jgi:dTDP-4-amino-4,6-dideoxygalactose transaminase
MTWKVPLFDLDLGAAEKAAVMDVLDSQWLTTGPRIERFEHDFAQVLGSEVHCVAVSNCTAALHMALIAAAVGPGDEVIVPSLTFAATANAVRYAGAKPVFADITSLTRWTISLRHVAQLVTPRTRAIIVMHYAGYSCGMKEFAAFAKANGLALIEDSAHSLITREDGQALGTFGDMGCFSFYSNKNMTTAEGGMIASRDEDLIKRLRILRSHGISKSAYDRHRGHGFGYDVVDLGYNYRMDEIRAALGIVQLTRLPGMNARRKDLAMLYRRLLSEKLPNIIVPFAEMANQDVAPHVFPVLLPASGPARHSVQETLSSAGIQTTVHYPLVHHFEIYRHDGVTLPVTEAIADRILTLPLFPAMRDEDVHTVCDELHQIYEKQAVK